MLKIGQKAIDFTLLNQNEEEISLASFLGKIVVLYFYPKDNTSGCTKQACAFRDVYDEILDLGAVVIGVSPDGVKSHQNFANKHDLPFHLLVDKDHQIAEIYGAWGLKKMYGKEYRGIIRTTYIIDKDGKVAKIYPKVRVKDHEKKILEAIKSLE
ncbi:MAG: thioredoxin-dependent thiol peroxidase [Clostridia bacterium]